VAWFSVGQAKASRAAARCVDAHYRVTGFYLKFYLAVLMAFKSR
jgi:hypothetical protein